MTTNGIKTSQAFTACFVKNGYYKSAGCENQCFISAIELKFDTNNILIAQNLALPMPSTQYIPEG